MNVGDTETRLDHVAAQVRPARSRRATGVGVRLAELWLATILACAITASWLPIDPQRFDLAHALRPPGWSHPFGTTRLGEDVFALCIHGTRVALIVGFGAAAIAVSSADRLEWPRAISVE